MIDFYSKLLNLRKIYFEPIIFW